uniref:Caveolin n=1 Tax=Sinocyclocheilus rhinocerous TaxID=307959 RepID=A0A673IFC0_9TELE
MPKTKKQTKKHGYYTFTTIKPWLFNKTKGINRTALIGPKLWRPKNSFPDDVSTQVTFGDVIARPASVRSFDKFYRIVSLLLAVPVALVAGLLFTVLSFIYYIIPCITLVHGNITIDNMNFYRIY